MERIFGFDIGTTSVGFAVIDHDPEAQRGTIQRMGVRIFPEARDPEGAPLNQKRRQKRSLRRQLRRRRELRRTLNQAFQEMGLLPPFGSSEWRRVMAMDPYDLRKRGLSERLEPYEFGRALYHLAKRRHFKGRDLEEEDGKKAKSGDGKEAEGADEKAAKVDRESTLQALAASDITLGAWLAERGPHERRRGVHAHRSVVEDEFDKLWQAQAAYCPALGDNGKKALIADVIFAQRPVFWRKNTLGTCRFMPGEALCPRGSWLSQQRRMLEKLNNLALAGGNARLLDAEERQAILEHLQTQTSMTWAGARRALKPLFKARGEAGGERSLKFNLEIGGDRVLLGNALEAKLFRIFGDSWADHPRKQDIRDAVHQRLWAADYGEIGTQRVIILRKQERTVKRAAAARSFVEDFGITPEQSEALRNLSLPTGWEPYSVVALQEFLPHLEAGVRFGALVNGPDWEVWRDGVFPDRDRPTGEILDRLPSPVIKEEQERIARLRNPTVVRTQNELRKVVNNLIDMFGKPDLIRVEVTRQVGKSKHDREETSKANRVREKRRKDAAKDLKSKDIAEPSNADIEKWLLWKESQGRCPYTGDQIGFDALFREGLYEVEHIWPRSKSFDNSFKNKTLCRKDRNQEKGNRTPFEAFGRDPEWPRMKERVWGMVAGRIMSRGKAKRFCDERPLPDDFSARQLNDTGYAARQALAFLQRLWPDVGPHAPVKVQAVTGRVTAQLRKLWELNNILADNGEKTRADHRHHAVDALTVACVHPGMTNRLSRYWQAKDDPRAARPSLPPPWATIRADAEKAVAQIVVSHRVRKKISGPLHKETTYGDTGEDVVRHGTVYRAIVQRTPITNLSLADLEANDLESARYVIRDPSVRQALRDAVVRFNGDVKKAMASNPTLGASGPAIRKVRLLSKRQIDGLVTVHNGFSDPESKHHVAIYSKPDGSYAGQIVSLYEAARRKARREPIVMKKDPKLGVLFMTLAKGDMIRFADKRALYWVVRELKSNGQITLVPHNEARATKEAINYMPTVSGLMKLKPRKISVDPIGRIRNAGD